MRATFGNKRHELNVSTYQMVILLLFNELDSLSYADILNITSIPPADLKRSLQSLACVKVLSRLLLSMSSVLQQPNCLLDRLPAVHGLASCAHMLGEQR